MKNCNNYLNEWISFMNRTFTELPQTRTINYVRKEHMRADVVEEPDKYIISLELPGFKKEEIKISVDNKILHVKASKEDCSKEPPQNYKIKERCCDSTERQFRLDKPTDPEKATSRFVDGILSIELPKIEKAKAKTISIE